MDNTQSYLELNQYKRVLKYATTPDWQEFKQISIISALGILLIGALGFFIFIVMFFIPG